MAGQFQQCGDPGSQARERRTAIVTIPASLMEGLEKKIQEAGFKNRLDGVTTILRDVVAGRIKYTQGILQSQ